MRHKARPKLDLKFRQLDGKQSPYCRALFDQRSRIRPFWCLVKGIEEFHPDGYYYQRVKRDVKWSSISQKQLRVSTFIFDLSPAA